MIHEAGTYVVVQDTSPYNTIDPGVHQLVYRLCCDEFKTCKHFGKSFCIIAAEYNSCGCLTCRQQRTIVKRWLPVHSIVVGGFTSRDAAVLAAKLLGVV